MLSIPFRGRKVLSLTTDNLTIGSTAMVVIDPNGDVIFVLGTDKNIKLLVSSKVLSIASKPFAAMFSPRFTESKGLSAAAPKEIPLPEDDAKAMTVLCKAIHHKLEDGDEPGTTLELLEVVVLADKYDCTKLHSLKLWTKDLPSSLPKDAFALLVMSYLSNDSKGFEAASLSLIRSQEADERFWRKWEEEIGANHVPRAIWCKFTTSFDLEQSLTSCNIALLEERRYQIANDIIFEPLRALSSQITACDPHPFSGYLLFRWSNTLWGMLHSHWPDEAQSINNLLKELTRAFVVVDDPTKQGKRLTDGIIIDFDLRKRIGEVLDETHAARGLCLACVRSVDGRGDLCSAHQGLMDVV